MRRGHNCVVFDHNADAVKNYVAKGASGVVAVAEFVQKLTKPRVAWVMVPAGGPTEGTVTDLGKFHGGRRHHHRRRQLLLQGRRPPHHEFKPKGIHYVDVGTSGGVWGIERGYCMMIGGAR